MPTCSVYLVRLDYRSSPGRWVTTTGNAYTWARRPGRRIVGPGASRFSGATVTYLRPTRVTTPLLMSGSCTVTLSPTRNFSSGLLIVHPSDAMRPGKPLWGSDHHIAPLVAGGVDTACAHFADHYRFAPCVVLQHQLVSYADVRKFHHACNSA